MPTLDLTTFRAEDLSSTKRRTQGIYTGPASYVAGGDPFVAADVKLGQLHLLVFGGNAVNAALAQRILAVNYTTGVIIWVVPDTGVEVAGAVDLSGFTVRFEAVGI